MGTTIEPAQFEVTGFAELGTEAQDYGNGVVRLHHALPARYAAATGIRRNSLARIENAAHDRLHAVVRFVNAPNPHVLGLEYDARAWLGIKKGQAAELTIRPARQIEYVGYLWGHPNIVVRVEFRLTMALMFSAFLLGLAASSVGL